MEKAEEVGLLPKCTQHATSGSHCLLAWLQCCPIGEDFTPSVEGQANHSPLFILITEKKNAMQMVQHRSTLCLVSEAQSLMVTSNSSSLGWFFFQFCRGGFACSKPLIW